MNSLKFIDNKSPVLLNAPMTTRLKYDYHVERGSLLLVIGVCKLIQCIKAILIFNLLILKDII